MKTLVLFLLLAVSCFAGDRVECADGRYSFEFPADWEKTRDPAGSADLSRTNPDGSVIASVTTQAIPENQKPDMEAVAKSQAAQLAKAIKFEGEAAISNGKLDGCDARFIMLLPEGGSIGMVSVFIDGGKDLIEYRAILTLPLSEEIRKQCLESVNSFKRESTKKEKSEDE